jgi:hypothetical protein
MLNRAAVASLARLLLRSMLPCPDPLRRRRIRQAARGLVTCTRWPGDNATPEDIAQLALLRLLWLQRQTRRAGRWRQVEATALLARACIETCLAGLYWLYGDDQVEKMGGNNAKSFRRLMSYIADGDPISPTLVKEVAATFGTATDLPSLLDMANVVAAKTHESFATDVYHVYTSRFRHFSHIHPGLPCCFTSSRTIIWTRGRCVSGRFDQRCTLRTPVWRGSP